jgi:hypothetical protein
MPSLSWRQWNTVRAAKLDEIEAAHRGIGGVGPGRRYATEQINHAYAVLLASQFQGFCRDLHSDCVNSIVRSVALVGTSSPVVLQSALRAEFVLNRSLDRGNATPGSIGADFNCLGVQFWARVEAASPRNARRKVLLERLNAWRNAIAHQDFDPNKLGGTLTLRLEHVRRWRRACNKLALPFDRIMHRHLVTVTGPRRGEAKP